MTACLALHLEPNISLNNDACWSLSSKIKKKKKDLDEILQWSQSQKTTLHDCMIARFSNSSHDNGCLFYTVSVMLKDNSVPLLWLTLMHIISGLQLFTWWTERVTLRTLGKGALKKNAAAFSISKSYCLSLTFAIVFGSETETVGLVVWIWKKIFCIHIIWQWIVCLWSSLFNVNTWSRKGSEFHGVNIIILCFETILCHRIVFLLTGDVIGNVPHLKMHLLYKTKGEDKETHRTSLFAGIKYVQPRR